MAVARAVDKLTDTSRLIELRMSFRAVEEIRVRNAFQLLAEGSPLPGDKGVKQKVAYLDFLQRVQNLQGPAGVALCAAALGPSKVASLKERERIQIPHEMKKLSRLIGGTLRNLAKVYEAEGTQEEQNQTLVARKLDERVPGGNDLLGHPLVCSTDQTMSHFTASGVRVNEAVLPKAISPDTSVINGQYWAFSFMNRHMIESLPDPFRTGIKRSNLWRSEDDSGGLAVSNCLSIYLPETNDEDAIFVARLGYDDGFTIFNRLGFGESVVTPQTDDK